MSSRLFSHVAGNRRILLSLAGVLAGAFSASSTHAQTGGTIWLDFVPNTPPGGYPTAATIGPETSFANAIRTLPGLAGLTNAQVTQVETDTTNLVNSKFTGLSFNITSNAGDPAAVAPSAPPNNPYTSIVIGAAGGANAGTLGQASQIDWRNLSFADSVGVSATAFNFGGNAYTVNANTDTIALALSNTIAHEIGHDVGLVHDDAAATYSSTAGTDAQKTAVVQSSDLMRANVTSFASATSTTTSFNVWSKIKLDVATHGVQLENQAAAVAPGFPGGADPLARTADSNTTPATATPLLFGPLNRVNVLGNSNGGGPDYYSFSGFVGEHVDFEIYSLGLERTEGDANSGRIAAGNSIGASTLSLFNNATALAPPVVTSMFPTTAGGGTSYDGSGFPNAYGDPLIYDYVLTSAGPYTLSVSGAQAGQYELFAVVPEPASIGLVLLAASALSLRRRRALV